MIHVDSSRKVCFAPKFGGACIGLCGGRRAKPKLKEYSVILIGSFYGMNQNI